MAIIDKKAFLNDLQDLLDEYIPAKTVRQILASAENALGGYEMMTVIPETPSADDSSQLIDLYINTRVTEGLAAKTIYQYRNRLNRLHDDIGVPLRKMTCDEFKEYIASELDRGISKNTIQGIERIYFKFYRWLYEEEYIPTNPLKNLNVIKARAEERKPFSAEEVQIIKENAANLKELAIIYFLLSTGCRVGELVSINRSDLDFKKLRLDVTGKGDKTRTIYFDDVTALMLNRYLSTRKDHHPALFVSRLNDRYTEDGIGQMMRRLSARTGIHIFPHRFRHTLAQILLDRGMSLEEVSAILGHSNLDTTKIYAKANKRNTENAYRRYACI